MSKLVICEKAELARDVARAMCGQAKGRPPFRGNGFVVCACSGHLLGLKEPHEVDERLGKWSEEDLPIAFDPWPLKAESEYAQGLLDVIAEELSDGPEAVYHCGDADDEGQLIVDEVLSHLGKDPSGADVLRVYVNDSIEKNIQRAFEEARPNEGCVGQGKAASARRLADMCFGVNESRLATLKLGGSLSVGRVQTPTLGLIVECDLARENHVSREFYALRVRTSPTALDFKCKPPADDLEDGKHCFDKARIEELAGAVEGLDGISFDVRHAQKRLEPPLPYNMTTIVADMSKRHGMTMEEVMEATQSLREKHKAITYNRSPSCYLKEEHHEQAPAVTECAMRSLGKDYELDLAIKSKAFDDSKVDAHHGIIPQERVVDLEKMTVAERRVYEAVALRYLVQFMPPAEYVEQSASFEAAGAAFSHKSNWVCSRTWMDVAPPEWASKSFAGSDSDGMASPGLHEGQRIEEAEVEEGHTSPPPKWTDGTLMVAMSNASKYVSDPEVKRILKEKDAGMAGESGGIGTAATRAQIIESLIRHGYVAREKGKLVSTERGRKCYSLVPDQLKGIDMTARWWLVQQEVASGGAPETAVMDRVLEEFAAHRDTAYAGKSLEESVGTCPRCGSAVVRRGSVYTCSSNKARKGEDGSWEDVAGCGFKMMPVCGKALTERQAASLLSGKDVPLKGLKKKAGGTFDAKCTLDAEGPYGTKLVFEDGSAKNKRTSGKPRKARVR